ncbi:histamine H2 receptor-like [Saccoglossus kowalevskii]|uniref:Histamine H2 receptor-like n=1 Tax=Saccoglossus kowalevskii TaxID=10224 RepID=A0ABM0MAG6_SACKO|nr:PREDICTED: histamine H2 receptor-like [Saccoglossus kowalevskii]
MGNDSEVTGEYHTDLSVLYATIMIVINFTTLFGNCVLLYIIIRTRQLHTITNVFIGSLAVGDLIMGILVMPYCAFYWIAQEWVFGDQWCQATAFFHSMSCTSTALNLAMVSVDRCFAVTRPLRYNVIMTSYSTATMVIYVWIHAILFAALPLFGWGSYRFSYKLGICAIDYMSDSTFILTERVMCTLLPALVITIMFIEILKEAHARQRRVFVALPVPWPINAQGQPTPNYKRTTIRAMRTLFVMVAVLTILCLPYHIIYFLCVYTPGYLPTDIESIASISMLASSAINPILITILNKTFYSRFKDIMCRRCTKLSAVVDVSTIEGSVAVAPTCHTQSTYIRSEATGSVAGGPSFISPELSSAVLESESKYMNEQSTSKGNKTISDVEENIDDRQRGTDKKRKNKHKQNDASGMSSQMNPNLLMPPDMTHTFRATRKKVREH